MKICAHDPGNLELITLLFDPLDIPQVCMRELTTGASGVATKLKGDQGRSVSLTQCSASRSDLRSGLGSKAE